MMIKAGIPSPIPIMIKTRVDTKSCGGSPNPVEYVLDKMIIFNVVDHKF